MTSIYNIIYKILTLTVHILKALVLCLCLFLSSVKNMLQPMYSIHTGNNAINRTEQNQSLFRH